MGLQSNGPSIWGVSHNTIYLAMIIALALIALSLIVASCAPAQPVWSEEEDGDWNSMGSGTYWTTVRPVRGSTQECIVVYTATANNRSVAVDCY
jgi:hypothetical protein